MKESNLAINNRHFVHDDIKVSPQLQRIYDSLFESYKPVLVEELICELIDLTHRLKKRQENHCFT